MVFQLAPAVTHGMDQDPRNGFWFTDDGDTVDFCDHSPPTWAESNNGVL